MKIEKQEVIDIVKANGLNEEEAEKLLEILAKKSGGALIDVLKLVVSKTKTPIDDVIVMSGEPTLRKLIDEIDINL